jgi:SOS response regulatory protein OraA/RecX
VEKAPVARKEVVEVLEQTQYLNDRSDALERASSLAERGHGDAVVRYVLEQERVGSELIERAIYSLALADSNRKRLFGHLVRRGFDPDTVE